MKYLIGEDCKVTMQGNAVTESKLSEDFVYDTDGKDLSVASMKEIADANNFKLRAKKTADLKKEFDRALSKLDLPEKREMSSSEKITEIVKAGVAAGKSEDEMLIEIVTSKAAKFQAAMKLMKAAMIDLGLSISSKERYTKSKVLLEDEEFEPETYDEVAAMSKKIAEKVPNTSEKQALAQIRKYCKEQEIEVPKKPASEKVPFGVQVLVWIAMHGNEKSTDDFVSWLEKNEKTEKFVNTWKKKFDVIKAEIEKSNAEKDTDSKTPAKGKGKGKSKK